MTKLYFIVANTADGDDLDLLVEANSTESAKSLWEEWADETYCDDKEGRKLSHINCLGRQIGTEGVFQWEGERSDPTLDHATEAFDSKPSPETALTLCLTANQYFRDAMITAEEHQIIISKVEFGMKVLRLR